MEDLDRRFKLFNVQLKVVGENLELVREFQDQLDLLTSCVEKSCKVSFFLGELRSAVGANMVAWCTWLPGAHGCLVHMVAWSTWLKVARVFCNVPASPPCG